jgi:predicted nucleotidyltransferase
VTLDEVRSRLARHREELATMGVASLAVFGSVARGEAGPASDVDLLVELNRRMGLFGFFAIQERLEEVLGCRVDLVMADGMKQQVRQRVLQEAVRAA